MKTLKHIFGLFVLASLVAVWPANTFAQVDETIQFDADLQYFRPYDITGANMFEMPTVTDVEYEGFKLKWGASFRQQWQTLTQKNNITDPSSGSFLPELGPGFNTANANLYLDAQVADGMLVHVFTYLSSRHHREARVKGGYLQIDRYRPKKCV